MMQDDPLRHRLVPLQGKIPAVGGRDFMRLFFIPLDLPRKATVHRQQHRLLQFMSVHWEVK